MLASRDLIRAVKHLNSKNQAKRSAAEQVLARLGVEGAEPLLSIIAREARKRNRRKLVFGAGVLAVWIVAFVLSRADKETANTWGPYWFLMLLGWVVGGAFLLPANRLQCNAVMALARMDDLRVVGPLAEAIAYGNDAIRPVVAEALTRLLPRLKASDADLLSETQRHWLRHVVVQVENALLAKMGVRRNAEFVIAVLKAQVEIADVKAIPNIERLLKSAKDPQVRETAEECLLSLRDHVQQEKAGQSLLRASDHSTPGETLLRPAVANANAAPEQLLRATSSITGDAEA